MKSVIYAQILSITVILVTLFSTIKLLLIQPELRETLQSTPEKVVQFGDIRFTFAILMVFGSAILTYFYITTWRSTPRSTVTRWDYNKKELITITIIALIVSGANYLTFNYTWDFAFIGLIVLIYEGLSLRKYYKS